MIKPEIAKEVLTTFEFYSYTQKQRNSRLPKISRKEWKRKADPFGRVFVLYYTDGSIGLKYPE
jgi:hypothetical protein